MIRTNAVDHVFVLFPWELRVKAHRIDSWQYGSQGAVADGAFDCSSVEDDFVADFMSEMTFPFLALYRYFDDRHFCSLLFFLNALDLSFISVR